MDYEAAKDYVDEQLGESLGHLTAQGILINHLLSYCIEQVLEITNGMILNEDTFRLDKNLQNLLVHPDAQGALLDLVDRIPENIADYFDDLSVKSPADILSKESNLTAAELSYTLCSLESRVISSPSIPSSVLGVRIFDRVFHFLTHPEQFSVADPITEEQGETGLIQFDEDDENSWKIDMADEPGSNKLYNDHIAAYHFTVEV